MIGSLFNDLQHNQGDETENPELTADLSGEAGSEDSLLASLGVAQKIVRSRRGAFWQAEASDILQAVALRLLKWRDKYRKKSAEMSPEEWESFTARAAFNEINRQLSSESRNAWVPLDSVRETVADAVLEGGSRAEVRSLATEVWQKICSLTLRQRQSLLLGGQFVVANLLQAGITEEEIAESLNMAMEDWAQVCHSLPLRDTQIADLMKRTESTWNSRERDAASIKKARHEARVKIRRVVRK